MTNYSWHMFMAHIPHDRIDEGESKLNEYDIRQYIIGLETADTVGQHMHFMVEMAPKQYTNFSKSLFIDKYKLRGQNRKGLCKQYGKMKTIENKDKALSYTCKSKNVRTNMCDADIKKFIEASFEKADRKKFIQELYDYLDTKISPNHFLYEDNYPNHKEIYDKIKLQIIKYYIENDLNLAPQYKSLIINYVRKTSILDICLKLPFLNSIIN